MRKRTGQHIPIQLPGYARPNADFQGSEMVWNFWQA